MSPGESDGRCCDLSSGLWRPGSLRGAPLDSLEQHRELRWRERDNTLLGNRPHEAPFLEALGKQAKTLAVPIKNLQQTTSAAAEGKKMASEGIELQELLHQHSQPVYTFSHICGPHGQVNAYAGRNRDHDRVPSNAATRRASRTGSIRSSNRTMSPFVTATSIAPGRCGYAVAGAAIPGAGVAGIASMRTGANSCFRGPFREIPGMPPR